jgi:hypothetical protein
VSYSREATQHVHYRHGLKLAHIRRIQVCIPPSPELAGQLTAFARTWDRAIRMLHARRLSRLARNVDIVLTSRRDYYARFWKGHILCINLRDLLAKGEVEGANIILHELGHRVWFHVARKKTRMRWAADHHQRLKLDRHGESFVSQYAKRNVLEDHAEAFSARVQGTLHGHARTRYERIGPLTRTIRRRLGSRA